MPVYACSADVMEDDVAAFIALGCDGALAKPVDLDALHAVLAKHLPPAGAVTRTAPAPITPTQPSAAAPADAMAAALAQIRQRFLAKVPEERASLADALRAAGAGEGRDTLVQLAHRLKGSAGTFGFDAVSSAAAILERAAKSPAEPVEASAAALDEALAALQSAEPSTRPKDALP
jgi:HPt (histidine-containing phosphotransfer) domain-containing protein